MSTLLELEHQLMTAKEKADRYAMVLRLENNPDFRKLILEEWCVTEAARKIALVEDPLALEHVRRDSLNEAKAPGHLKRFLHYIKQEGQLHADTIPALERAVEEVRFEEQED